MFSTENANEYLNVYLTTTPDPVVSTSLWLIAAAGFLIMMGKLVFEGSDRSIMAGVCALVLGLGGVAPLQITARANMEVIKENMSSNIQKKYGAVLGIDEKKVTNDSFINLDKPKKYTLIFPDEAVGEYEIYFKDTNEPVVVTTPPDTHAV